MGVWLSGTREEGVVSRSNDRDAIEAMEEGRKRDASCGSMSCAHETRRTENGERRKKEEGERAGREGGRGKKRGHGAVVPLKPVKREAGLRRRPAPKPPISLLSISVPHPSTSSAPLILPPPHPPHATFFIAPLILHPPNECPTEVISEEGGAIAAISVEEGVAGPAGVVRRPVPRSPRRTTSST